MQLRHCTSDRPTSSKPPSLEKDPALCLSVSIRGAGGGLGKELSRLLQLQRGYLIARPEGFWRFLNPAPTGQNGGRPEKISNDKKHPAITYEIQGLLDRALG